MELEMSAEEVITQIKEIHNNGLELSKKKLKKSHPTLVKNALFYFPSWEHALNEAGLK